MLHGVSKYKITSTQVFTYIYPVPNTNSYYSAANKHCLALYQLPHKDGATRASALRTALTMLIKHCPENVFHIS
jgi:hypothetical protein